MKSLFAGIVSLLAVLASAANADVVSFSTADNAFDSGVPNQGWWSDSIISDNLSPSYEVGSVSGALAETRNFFSFDLSSVGSGDVVTSATLRLQRFGIGLTNETFEQIEFFDVSTDAATLNNNFGTSSAIFSDLGTGISYGRTNQASAGNGSDFLEFVLNADAVNDINASRGGWFSIGGKLNTISGNDRFFVGSSGGQVLALNVVAVPEPSSFVALAVVGIPALLIRRNQ